MICSTGKVADDTPIGVHSIYWRSTYGDRNYVHMIDDSWGAYSCKWLESSLFFHSICYKNLSNDSLLTEEYNNLGNAASAGCIRLQLIDARWIYDNCADGTTVVVYDDADNPGPLGKPEKEVAEITTELDCGWDPTDPLPENPWRYR